jgi:catecholate siderophore receptor
LAFSTALFRLDRENTPIRDNTNVAVAAGASRVDGVEVSLAGRVTERWQMTAGYANLYARYLTDTSNAAGTIAARAGNHVPFTPVHTYSLWNRYDFTQTWGAGLGVIAQSEYYANADNQVHVPGFARVDGAIFFTLNKNFRAQVNVENLFGVKYYPSADANNNITIGSPRAARVVLTANF